MQIVTSSAMTNITIISTSDIATGNIIVPVLLPSNGAGRVEADVEIEILI